MKKLYILLSSKDVALSAVIFLLGLWYRFPLISRPFWVDEFSTAIQAQLFNLYGLQVFTQSDYYFEYHNITTHVLIGLSFKSLGLNETAARIPIVIFGAIVPVMGYFLAKKLFSSTAGLVAGLLLATSYFQLAWSQQARGYMIQQVLVLASLLLYFNILKQKKPIINIGLLLGLFILGILTHITFIFVIAAFVVHATWFYRKRLLFARKKPLLILFLLICLGLILYISGSASQILAFMKNILSQGLVNNLWYYHSFLWREQTLITFLGLIGLGLLMIKNPQANLILGLIIGFYLFFLVFLFPPYVTRYLLPIFPLLLIGMARSIAHLSQLFVDQAWFKPKNQLWPTVISLGIVFFIIANGHTFVLKPKPFYSPNQFLREIPLLDYNQVYQPILNAQDMTDQPIAVIDPWLDRAKWYLGLDYPDLFVFRWSNSPDTTNGLSRVTPFELNQQNYKILPLTGPDPAILVSELADIVRITDEYQYGFIWIDDVTLPADVIAYAEDNFVPEVTVDRYPLDENPLSVWPGTLYSWGFHD